MSDANTSALAFQREITWGQLPVSPALKLIRMTGEAIAHEKETIQSEEIRADRQISDLAQVGAQASGSFSFELSYSDFKAWWENALFSTISTFTLTASLALAASTQRITGSNGDFANVMVGGFVKVSGASTTANNGPKLVIGKGANSEYLVLAPGSIATDETTNITVAGGFMKNGQTRHSSVFEKRILSTTGQPTYQRFPGMVVDTAEINFESKQIITGEFTFLGRAGEIASVSIMDSTGTKAAGTLTLSGNAVADETVTIGTRVYTFKASPSAADQIKVGSDAADTILNIVAAINGAAGSGTLYGTGTLPHATVTAEDGAGDTVVLTAKSTGTAGNSIATSETMTNASFGSATLAGGVDADAYLPASTDPVMNATANMGNFYKDGATMTERFKSLSLSIANNLRGKDAIGELGNWDIGVGSIAVTGNFNCYFQNTDLFRDFINHTYTGLAFTVRDGLGNMIGVHLPRLNYSTGNSPIEAINTDVMQSVDFTAILSDTYGGTIFVSFLDA